MDAEPKENQAARAEVGGTPEVQLPLVYDELLAVARGLMRGQPPGHTLQPTALVHEAYVKLTRSAGATLDRDHYLCLAARAMRQILVDHARGKRSLQRGGAAERECLDALEDGFRDQGIDLVVLTDSLESLEPLDPDLVRLVELKVLLGLEMAEVAAALGLSKRSAERKWTLARSVLRRAHSERRGT